MNRRESYRSERGGLNDDCPIEATLDIVGGKWKVLILFYLMKGTVRFGEFQRLIPKITQRMLTLQLGILLKPYLGTSVTPTAA